MLTNSVLIIPMLINPMPIIPVLINPMLTNPTLNRWGMSRDDVAEEEEAADAAAGGGDGKGEDLPEYLRGLPKAGGKSGVPVEHGLSLDEVSAQEKNTLCFGAPTR
jgi:hypothetical protein